ncbi:MAG TPA: DUF2569 domain-containing protein [Blastocatellia bacterium]|nr:DUF2569 domain-containing protein [Blastocatellia bacterium]
MQIEPSKSMPVEEAADLDRSPAVAGEEKPPRIGGWLIMVAIGLCFNLLQNLSSAVDSMALVIRTSLWRRLTDPASPTYHPSWKLLLIFEAAANLLILLATIAALWLFFRKKRAFPKLTAISLPLIFVAGMTSYFLARDIPAVVESAEYARQWDFLVMRFVMLHLWIPYLLLSKRVRRTFVR